jgi:hypothetical protein
MVFLEVRAVPGVTGLEKLGDSVAETVVWMCVAFSLLFADWCCNGRTFAVRAPRLQEFSRYRQCKPQPISMWQRLYAAALSSRRLCALCVKFRYLRSAGPHHSSHIPATPATPNT